MNIFRRQIVINLIVAYSLHSDALSKEVRTQTRKQYFFLGNWERLHRRGTFKPSHKGWRDFAGVEGF